MSSSGFKVIIFHAIDGRVYMMATDGVTFRIRHAGKDYAMLTAEGTLTEDNPLVLRAVQDTYYCTTKEDASMAHIADPEKFEDIITSVPRKMRLRVFDIGNGQWHEVESIRLVNGTPVEVVTLPGADQLFNHPGQEPQFSLAFHHPVSVQDTE